MVIDIQAANEPMAYFTKGLYLRLDKFGYIPIYAGEKEDIELIHYRRPNKELVGMENILLMVSSEAFLRIVPLTLHRCGPIDRRNITSIILRDNKGNKDVDKNYKLTDMVVDMMAYHKLISDDHAEKIKVKSGMSETYNFNFH